MGTFPVSHAKKIIIRITQVPGVKQRYLQTVQTVSCVTRVQILLSGPQMSNSVGPTGPQMSNSVGPTGPQIKHIRLQKITQIKKL